MRLLQSRLPRLVLGLVIVACVIGAFVVAAIAVAFVGPADATRISQYLATIGGLMGAIFAAGGLVIGLVSVLTLLTVEDRAARVFQRQFEELRPELERLSDDRIRAHLLLRDAERLLASLTARAGDPSQILSLDSATPDRLVSDALSAYPDLPNARRTVGLGLNEVVRTHVYATAVAAYHWIDTSRASEMCRRSIAWLEQARACGEDSDGAVSVALAQMYGATGQFDRMRDAILGHSR